MTQTALPETNVWDSSVPGFTAGWVQRGETVAQTARISQLATAEPGIGCAAVGCAGGPRTVPGAQGWDPAPPRRAMPAHPTLAKTPERFCKAWVILVSPHWG